MKTKNVKPVRAAPVSSLLESIEALQKALEICASSWGWWNEEPGWPEIARRLPKHPCVQAVIRTVERVAGLPPA